MLVSQVVTQRDAHLLNTREMSAAFREAFPPSAARCSSSAGRASTRPMAAELGVDRIFGRGHHARRGAPATWSHRLADVADRKAVMTGRGRPRRSTHRRYVPYSHAHYAGNLVDGAYALGLFGDVATEVCIRTDGDEGLFASYSDVQFRPRCGPATSSR